MIERLNSHQILHEICNLGVVVAEVEVDREINRHPWKILNKFLELICPIGIDKHFVALYIHINA